MVEIYLIRAGRMIVQNPQPESPLIAAILELEAEIIDLVLREERGQT
jgi:hypothetical protein